MELQQGLTRNTARDSSGIELEDTEDGEAEQPEWIHRSAWTRLYRSLQEAMSRKRVIATRPFLESTEHVSRRIQMYQDSGSP